MAKLENEADFLQFVAKELGVAISEITAITQFRGLKTWSSLNALYLITRISEEEGIFITSSELAKCICMKDIHSLIVNKIIEKK
jgi:acyl carrier protein